MRKQLSKQEIKKLIADIKEKYSYDVTFNHKARVELIDDVYYVDGAVSWFVKDGELLPHLKLLQSVDLLKSIYVDMGAVKFVTGGADVFRPGIEAFDEGIAEGEYIAVKEITHKKTLALGQAMASGRDMEEAEGGKVIKNIHWVGDEMWNL